MAKQTWVNIGGTWKQVKNVWVRIGGVWKQQVIPKGLIGAAWKEFMQYFVGIYNDGVEYYPLATTFSDGNSGTKQFIKNETNLYIRATYTSRIFVATGLINVTNIKKIEVDWSVTTAGYGGVVFGLASNNKDAIWDVSYTQQSASLPRQKTIIDVSSLQGNYYFKIQAFGGGSAGSQTVEAYIYKIEFKY